MRTAHFDCFSGISGDMVLGAVIDAGVPVEKIRSALESLKLPLKLEVERVKRSGIMATKANVIAEDQESHRHLPDVRKIIEAGELTDRQKALANSIFQNLAEAEAEVHGIPIERVHFHEVGALDSIADIVGSAVGLDALGVDRFSSGPVATGTGMVKCDHGLMPIPAPATAVLLKQHRVPLLGVNIKAELTTPTGAAILTTVVSEYTASPAITIEQIGWGSGSKDLIEQPNLLRLLVGSATAATGSVLNDTVWVLECQVDDCPGEWLGYATEALLAAGALDVYQLPVQMKKGRPGVLLTVICTPDNCPNCESILFRETGTLGVRKRTTQRVKLAREAVTVDTPWGPLQGKRATLPDGSTWISPEYEDAARIAREAAVPLREVYSAVLNR